MKKSCIFLLIVCLIGMACEKSKTLDDSISVWKCTPNADVSIILTFNSEEKNKVYVHTFPDTLPLVYLIRTSGVIGYTMLEDTIFPISYDNTKFLKTMISKDSMLLSYLGYLPAIPIVREYLFINQIKNK